MGYNKENSINCNPKSDGMNHNRKTTVGTIDK